MLVSSEWYLYGPGLDKPASFDMAKAHEMAPDWVTWNGYAGQYVKHPLTANPGETVALLGRRSRPELRHRLPRRRHAAQPRLGRRRPDAVPQTTSRRSTVPAGGGGVFDVKIDEPGLYPFVSHSFASVDMGQVGLLKVGNVQGTMSH